MDASQIIDALGGTSRLAAAIGVSAPAVSMWRKEGIPASRWAAIVQLGEATERGITFQALAASTVGQPTAA